MEGEGTIVAASPPVVPVVRKGLATKLPLGQRLLIRWETGWESCVIRGCTPQTDGAPAMLHRVEYDDGACHQLDLSTLDIMLKDSNVVEGPPPTTSRHDDFAGAPPACNPVDSAPASSGKRSGTTASRGEGKMPKVPRVSPGGAEALEASPVEDPERVAHPRTGPEARDTVIVRGLPPNLCLACKKGSPQPVALPGLSPWHNIIGWHLLTSRPDASLEAAFQVVGQIEQAIVLRERTNFKATGNGLGYVTFVREDDAVRAVEQLDGLLFQGRAISLEITSTPKQAKQMREVSDEVQLATQPCPPLTHTFESSCKQPISLRRLSGHRLLSARSGNQCWTRQVTRCPDLTAACFGMQMARCRRGRLRRTTCCADLLPR